GEQVVRRGRRLLRGEDEEERPLRLAAPLLRPLLPHAGPGPEGPRPRGLGQGLLRPRRDRPLHHRRGGGGPRARERRDRAFRRAPRRTQRISGEPRPPRHHGPAALL
ncbi:MAG: hypothetical protein AVDCRST_MAG25-2381, partial [uncultured Rubrobacteraceae bacterium]